jgi:hypothetical protein
MPHDRNHRQESEDDLHHERQGESQPCLIPLGEETADEHGDEVHKGIHQAGQHRRGEHVAVKDMAHLMRQHRPDFLFVQIVQQPRRDRDHGIVSGGARREGVRIGRFIDPDFRHGDAEALRDLLHRPVNDVFGLGAGLRDLVALSQGGPGELLRKRQAEECAAESEEAGHRQQRGRVGAERNAERRQHDAHDHVDRDHEQQVGDQQQCDTLQPLHRILLHLRVIPGGVSMP